MENRYTEENELGGAITKKEEHFLENMLESVQYFFSPYILRVHMWINEEEFSSPKEIIFLLYSIFFSGVSFPFSFYQRT